MNNKIKNNTNPDLQMDPSIDQGLRQKRRSWNEQDNRAEVSGRRGRYGKIVGASALVLASVVGVASGVIKFNSGPSEGITAEDYSKINGNKPTTPYVADPEVTKRAKEIQAEKNAEKQRVIDELNKGLEDGSIKPSNEVITLKTGVNIRNNPFEFGEAEKDGGFRRQIAEGETATIIRPIKIQHGDQELVVVYDPKSNPEDPIGFISGDVLKDSQYALVEVTDVLPQDMTVLDADDGFKVVSDAGKISVSHLNIQPAA